MQLADVPGTTGRSLRIDQCGQVENPEPYPERRHSQRSLAALVICTDALYRIEHIDESFARRQRHDRRRPELARIHEEWQPSLDTTRICFPFLEKTCEPRNVCVTAVVADVEIVGDTAGSVCGRGKSAYRDELHPARLQALKHRGEAHCRRASEEGEARRTSLMNAALSSSCMRRSSVDILRPSRRRATSTP